MSIAGGQEIQREKASEGGVWNGRRAGAEKFCLGQEGIAHPWQTLRTRGVIEEKKEEPVTNILTGTKATILEPVQIFRTKPRESNTVGIGPKTIASPARSRSWRVA